MLYKTGFYQPAPDFCDVPEETYQSSLQVVICAWAKFVKQTKKSKKKKDTVLREPKERAASLPAWALNENERVQPQLHQSMQILPSNSSTSLLGTENTCSVGLRKRYSSSILCITNFVHNK